ncbi:EF-hand calcium-binding domain-containing protein 11-like [Watersipora subatra]|uniref:EF-hand calcium-binding domain-containing protein 11-like n=1 Tax=Watersipora subatra TaxID=2589382 RepID=UPI00355C75C5
MDVADSVSVTLKCAAISKFGYKPSKRLISEFLSQHTNWQSSDAIEHLVKPFLEYISRQCRLPTDSTDEIRATFLAFDLKGQGCISKADFITVAKSIVPKFSESQIRHIFRQVDKDNDGCVTYKEFERMMLFDP